MIEEEDRSLDLAMNERGALRELIESRGWQVLMEIADAQRSVKTNQMNKPCTMEDFPKQEFEKGEALGIRLFQLMPGDAIDALSLEIEDFQAALPRDTTLDDNEEENEDATRKAP